MMYQEKLDTAINWLGERWVFHPARHIKRGDYRPQEIHKADVGETFRRELARIASEHHIIVKEIR